MHALKYVRPFALVAAVSLVLAGCGADEPYDLTTDYVPAEVPASVEVNTDVQEMEVVNAESDEMENFNQGTFAEVEGLAEAAEKWQALGEQTDEELGRDDFGHVNVFAQADEAGGASYGQAVFINGGANDWAAAPGSYTFEVICFSPIGVGYTVRADAEDESGGWVVAGTCGDEQATTYRHTYENPSAEAAIGQITFLADEPAPGFAIIRVDVD